MWVKTFFVFVFFQSAGEGEKVERGKKGGEADSRRQDTICLFMLLHVFFVLLATARNRSKSLPDINQWYSSVLIAAQSKWCLKSIFYVYHVKLYFGYKHTYKISLDTYILVHTTLYSTSVENIIQFHCTLLLCKYVLGIN